MKVAGKLILAFVGSVFLYGVGVEVAEVSPAVKVPPGTIRVDFGDLAKAARRVDAEQARPGDFLKAMPGAVRRLDGARVLVQGFMIPTRGEGRGVSAFLLVRSQANCCFGMPLQVSDMVEVHLAGKPAERLMDRVLCVVGTLHVRERWAGQDLGSLYQLDADQVTSAAALPAAVLAAGARTSPLE